MPLTAIPAILYGADYNPEQWPEGVWEDDVHLMEEAGVNIVSLNIFGWAKLHPAPDRWDFGWLDRLMDLLHSHGIAALLATATASPPQWLIALHPDILPLRRTGRKAPANSTRMHFCPSSPLFREHQLELVEGLAQRYKDHPALAIWHVSNEYYTRCDCEISAAHFRRWLQNRYPSLDALNEAWGTSVWGQTFTDWSQITAAPSWPEAERNLGQAVDYSRFTSDAMLESFAAERDLLHRLSPGIPVINNLGSLSLGTTSPWFSNGLLDFWRWGAAMDFVAADIYPNPADPNGAEQAMKVDLVRSVGRGRPWLMTETSPSGVNYLDVNVPKRPGQHRLWTYQTIAHGADGAMVFQWRQARASWEQYHSAMLPPGGEVTATWRECRRLGQELKGLGELVDGRSTADVAIALDWESAWVLELEGKPNNTPEFLRFISILRSWYRTLYAANYPTDYVQPADDLSAYRAIVIPNLYAVSLETAANLTRYVENGGTLVVGPFSGIADVNHLIHLGRYPAAFRELLGLWIDDFWPTPSDARFPVSFAGGEVHDGSMWRDWIELEGAEVIARFDDGPVAGRAAVTRHRVGKGVAWYVGTCLDHAGLGAVVRQALAEAGVKPLGVVPARVELTRRTNEHGSYVFVLNHNDYAVDLPLDIKGVDLITGSAVHGALSLERMGVAIVREEGSR